MELIRTKHVWTSQDQNVRLEGKFIESVGKKNVILRLKFYSKFIHKIIDYTWEVFDALDNLQNKNYFWCSLLLGATYNPGQKFTGQNTKWFRQWTFLF